MMIPLRPSRLFLLFNVTLLILVAFAAVRSALPESLRVLLMLSATLLAILGSFFHCRHQRGVLRFSDDGLYYDAGANLAAPSQLIAAGGWSDWILGVEIRLPPGSLWRRRHLLFLPDNISADDWRRLRIYLRASGS